MAFNRIIGDSPAMHKVFNQIKQAAVTEIPIMLIGETGTGKDLVAQAIHNYSPRKDQSYIPVNLGAIPTQLVASELFGHEKGAFTGALRTHEGKFEQADKGTIFLDEIDAIDEKVQVSLLRLIEHKKFQRLGGTNSIAVDVRMIVATNADIDDLVNDNNFREDLFYRMDVFRITLPPLRARKTDLSLLCDAFLQNFNKSFDKNISGISPSCMDVFYNYEWPGNIRELKNVVQRAVLLCNGEQIQTEHLPARFKNTESEASGPELTFTIGTPLDTVEKEMILAVLNATANNRTEAARLLGISRRALYNRLSRHNIK